MDDNCFVNMILRALEGMTDESFEYQKTHGFLLDVTRKTISRLDQENYHSTDRYVLIFAGPNASGKSTIAKYILNDVDLAFLNPDMIAKIYFDHIIDEMEKYKNNAMPFSEGIRTKYVNSGISFSIETVFSDSNKLHFVSSLKERGFKIYTIWMGTNDPYINIERAIKRQEAGGHIVPAEKITARYYKSMDNLLQLLQLSDTAVVIDNSKEKPILMIQKNEKEYKIICEDTLPNWIEVYVGNELLKV